MSSRRISSAPSQAQPIVLIMLSVTHQSNNTCLSSSITNANRLARGTLESSFLLQYCLGSAKGIASKAPPPTTLEAKQYWRRRRSKPPLARVDFCRQRDFRSAYKCVPPMKYFRNNYPGVAVNRSSTEGGCVDGGSQHSTFQPNVCGVKRGGFTPPVGRLESKIGVEARRIDKIIAHTLVQAEHFTRTK